MKRRRASDLPGTDEAALIPEEARNYEISSFLLLRVGDEYYALPSACVSEIARWRMPTPVPGAPAVLPGIINHRGVVLPVVHLALLLGLPETEAGRSTRYLIARHGEVDLALLVDAIIDMVNLPEADREPLPTTLNPQQARLLIAITRLDDLPVALLDLAEIVTLARGEA